MRYEELLAAPETVVRGLARRFALSCCGGGGHGGGGNGGGGNGGGGGAFDALGRFEFQGGARFEKKRAAAPAARRRALLGGGGARRLELYTPASFCAYAATLDAPLEAYFGYDALPRAARAPLPRPGACAPAPAEVYPRACRSPHACVCHANASAADAIEYCLGVA